MTNFEKALELTLKKEGGIRETNTKHDRGGFTFSGISRKKNPHWKGWKYFDKWGEWKNFDEADKKTVLSLMKDFYKHEFWDVLRLDKVKSGWVAYCIFDFAVTSGQGNAAKLAQRTAQAGVDGIVGSKTLEAINKCVRDDFVVSFCFGRVVFYSAIVKRDASQARFMVGWAKRSAEVVAEKGLFE